MRRHPLKIMALALLSLALPLTHAAAQTIRSVGQSEPNNAIEITAEARDGSSVPAWARGVVLINPSTGQPYAASGSGGGGAGTEFAEDAPHTSGALGTLSLGVRKDTCASLASTDGDYASMIFDSNGRLCTSFSSPLPVTDNGGSLTVDGSVSLTGTLPAFAATPTVNLGTLGSAATAAGQTDVQVTAGAVKANRSVIYDASGNPVDWTAPAIANLVATTTGGCTPYGLQSAASTNATSVATGARTLCGLTLINTSATVYYARLYNLAAAPTCSSSTGFVYSVPIPAATTGAGVTLDFGSFGQAFGTGLALCITGGGSSTDNTNAATGVYLIASYK